MVDAISHKFFGCWVAIAVAVAVIAFGGLSVTTVQLARQAQFWVSHTHAVIVEAKGLLASMVDAETGRRGYIITGDEGFLEPYREALTHVPLNLEGLKALIADNPAQQTRLAQMEPLIKAKLEMIAKATEVRDQGQATTSIDKAEMDKFRLAQAAFEQEENRLYIDRSAKLEGRYALIEGLALALVFLIGAASVFGFRQYRQVNALQSSNYRFRLAMELNATAAYTMDRELRCTWVHFPIAGNSIGGSMGKRLHDVLVKETADRLTGIYSEVLRTGQRVRFDLHVQSLFRPDHGHFDYAVEPLRDAKGAISGVIVAATNITALKRSETALGDSEARLRSVLDNCQQVI